MKLSTKRKNNVRSDSRGTSIFRRKEKSLPFFGATCDTAIVP